MATSFSARTPCSSSVAPIANRSAVGNGLARLCPDERQPGSYPPGCSRQPRGMDAESGASIARIIAGRYVGISAADPPDVSPRRGGQPSRVRSACSSNSSDDERGDLKDGTVGKLGGDASTRRGVASSTRQICATSEAANSTLLTPSAGTVSQIRCEVTRVRQRHCGHYQ